MTQEQKDKWVAALRSGEYKQYRGGACNKSRSRHCCLDVLRVVLRVPGKLTSKQEWETELDQRMRALLDVRHQVDLANMNDEGNKSFAEIADYIEQNIEATA